MDRSLIPLTHRPFNAETPLAALTAALTPVEQFFVRSNFDVPSLAERTWRLDIDGALDQPRAFTLDDLRRLPVRDIAVTMECAGNGRALMQPVPPGTPWQLGAVSTGMFTGVALRDVLSQCGVRADVVEIVCAGADHGDIDGRDVRFERSLPLARALHPNTLLAWALNGAPLTPAHGYPVRLLVPGWYGVASVKWLVRVTAAKSPFTGHFQTERYIFRGDAQHADATPVTRTLVRSLIAEPASSCVAIRGRAQVRGIAWSGFGAIRRVQLSFDGAVSWVDAVLTPPLSSCAATAWHYLWEPRDAGDVEIIARAEDEAGNVQPLEPRWNEFGYANNVAHRVRVKLLAGS
ncbi:MAG TPA: sulfite oxidase [Longimicrobiales bacterium]|nr:sulfite oxidase [Longimicrobiales bacterium]